MKKYLKYIVVCIILIIILIGVFGVINFKSKDEPQTEIAQQPENVIEYVPQENIDKNESAYKDNITVEELKQEVGATGNEEIYDVISEYDGRKVLTIKPEIQFDVVLAGILDKQKPENNLESLSQKGASFLNKKGIWIEESSRTKFLSLLKETSKNNYEINSEGYLIYSSNAEANQIDKNIEKIINSDNLYIITITGTCYTLDEISGEIVEYPFEKMDQYQTNEIYTKGNNKIYVVTTNEKNLLSNEEIMNAIFCD